MRFEYNEIRKKKSSNKEDNIRMTIGRDLN
jgi:hypothetical protein